MQPVAKGDLEGEAAWTVAALLSGVPQRSDRPGAPPATHDIDICLPDGRVVALEVTSSTVPEVVEMWDAINAVDWACDELSEGWSITLDATRRGLGGAKVRRFRKEAPQWLSVLEQVDPVIRPHILNNRDHDLGREAMNAITHLRRLGVRGGGSVGPTNSGPTYIVVGTVGPGGPVDGSTVNSAVEAATLANLTKLLKAEADERHLFLWVDATDSPSSAAMSSFARPEPPELPHGIDCVWVALWMRGISPQTNAHTLWRLVPPGPWAILHLPAVHDYAARRTAG